MTRGERLLVIETLERAIRVLEQCDRMELAPSTFRALGPIGDHLLATNPLVGGPVWEREASGDDHPLLPPLREARNLLESSLTSVEAVANANGPDA